MDPSVRLRRLGYRLASRVIALGWALFRVRRGGVKCVITDGDRLLLVRHTYGPPGWDLPGGAHHRGESPVHTADREMAEELGLGAVAWRDLGELRSVRGSHRVQILGAEVSAPRLHIDPVELEVAAWFERDRLPRWRGPLLTPILDGIGLATGTTAVDPPEVSVGREPSPPPA